MWTHGAGAPPSAGMSAGTARMSACATKNFANL
jgi:hypothetical protein